MRAEVDRFMHNIRSQCEVILVNDGSSDGTPKKLWPGPLKIAG
jgi:glycosyltransferase involved in cell wall biosynthesis